LKEKKIRILKKVLKIKKKKKKKSLKKKKRRERMVGELNKRGCRNG